MAKDCPDKHMRNTQQSTTLCLRCGETGHDMFGCANDYPPGDVKVGSFLPLFLSKFFICCCK
jgi:hypothetical protein